MGAKQFVIWIDYTTGKWRNDGPLIMDFLFNIKFLLVITVIIMIKLCWIFLLIIINILM